MNIMIAQSSCCCFGDGFCVFFANETNANNNNIAEFSEEDSYMRSKIDKCFSVLFVFVRVNDKAKKFHFRCSSSFTAFIFYLRLQCRRHM